MTDRATDREPAVADEFQHVGPEDSPLLQNNADGPSSSSLPSGEMDDKATPGQHDSKQQRPSLAPGIASVTRRPSFIDEEEQPIAQAASSTKDAPVTWRSLPNKTQLFVITFARLSEPLTERSMAAYLFYQLRWFDDGASDSTIASQGGILTAAFAAAQFLTAVWWGRAADSPWIGRKRVLLIGLFGSFVACMGIGFAKTFAQALFFRALAGALNGNVGVLRTMISEIIKEKKYQSRAFLLLPMCFNIGVIIGPILGGFLADPISSFPSTFGPGSALGGENGVGWMTSFPYALPNLVSGFTILGSFLGVILGLDETHQALRDKPDHGRRIGKYLARLVFRRPSSHEYSRVGQHEDENAILMEERPTSASPATPRSRDHFPRSLPHPEPPPPSQSKEDTASIPFKSIFTKNVTLTLVCHHLMALHVSTFNALIFLLLPTPRAPNNSHNLFRFTGGLSLSTEQVGMATAIIGIIGLPLQLLLYPRLSERLGTLTCYRLFLPFSILAYFLLPYLSLLPAQPTIIWPALTFVFASQVLSRTFALPSTVILVNNSTPSPRALGTIHGVAQSVSSGARMVGPVLGGWVLGWGLKHRFVGGVWWGMAVVAALNWGMLWVVWEGDGYGGRA